MSTPQFIQNKITRAVISDLIAYGFLLSVHNGGDDFNIKNSSNRQAVYDACRAKNEAILCASGPVYGRIHFIYGADSDCIEDYSYALEPFLWRALDIIADNESRA